MKLLAPLGLLGLIGIIILIIIYIIKPSFQQKSVSSTYIWKLSLKYKKKRVPISRLRNLLIIICQISIIALSALILAEPNKVIKEQTDQSEVIAILDSSASMRAINDGYTRFERATEKIVKLSEDTFAKNGIVSVIVANNNPYYLVQRAESESNNVVNEKINELVENNGCSYGVSDIDGAISICEDVLVDNPEAKIYIFTDNTYSFVPSSIKIENVSSEEEWNAGILNAYAEVEDNYFTFYVDVACYGRSREIEVEIEISGANTADKTEVGSVFSYKSIVACPDGVSQRIIFKNQAYVDEEQEGENVTVYPIDALYSYQRVMVKINEEDSFVDDDTFYIYGGQKEPLKIQYASAMPETFVPGAFYKIKSFVADWYDVVFDEVKVGNAPATEGYDLYIYEHKMPDELPTDGAVLLINPYSSPAGSGLTIGDEVDFRAQMIALTEETPHEVLKGVNSGLIEISRYIKIERHDSGYEEVLTCNGSPVLLIKNEGSQKIAVISFSYHYSNLGIMPENAILLKNLVNYFMPAIVKGNSFEVNEKVNLNTRGENLSVSGNVEKIFDEFPAILDLDLPGTYDIMQTTYFGKLVTESIYVRIPSLESNIRAVLDGLSDPYGVEDENNFYIDLLMYFALALVVIELIEWFLQTREGN